MKRIKIEIKQMRCTDDNVVSNEPSSDSVRISSTRYFPTETNGWDEMNETDRVEHYTYSNEETHEMSLSSSNQENSEEEPDAIDSLVSHILLEIFRGQ